MVNNFPNDDGKFNGNGVWGHEHDRLLSGIEIRLMPDLVKIRLTEPSNFTLKLYETLLS